MNKKLIAIAVGAALAAPMVAQADVTVYGKAQLELANTKYDGAVTAANNETIRGLTDQGKMGRVGVNATEDLGNGMTGLAHFGYIMQTGTPTGATTTRQSYVGIAGGFGTVRFGRLAGAYKDTNLDPYIATTLEARSYGGESRGAYGHNGFIDDAVKYNNKFGNLKFEALATLGNANNGDNGNFQLAADYRSGPLRVVLAYSKHKQANGANGPAEKRSKLAAQYKIGPGKATLSYESVKDYAASNLGGLPEKAITGLVLPADLGDVRFIMASYDMNLGNMNSLYVRYGNEKYKDQGDLKVKSYAIALKHMMSKTFRVWVGYNQVKADGITGFSPKMTNFTVGMRKDF